mmetsp:Transcript_32657/g.74044  ORF Transcript_32657/g.74044 Transcript_32657/m.74044 type:complete len:206 (-) Transcript_32657:357-974(-)
MAILANCHGGKLRKRLLRVMGWVVVASASPALITVAPPPLLEGWPSRALPVLDEADQLRDGKRRQLLDHQAMLLSESLLMCQHLVMHLLLFLHDLEKLPLLVVLHNFEPGLPITWKDLLLLIDTKPHSLTLGEGHLHRTQIALVRNQHALLMQVLDCLLRSLQCPHAHEGTADTALSLRSDDEHLEYVPELFKTLLEHVPGDLPG